MPKPYEEERDGLSNEQTAMMYPLNGQYQAGMTRAQSIYAIDKFFALAYEEDITLPMLVLHPSTLKLIFGEPVQMYDLVKLPQMVMSVLENLKPDSVEDLDAYQSELLPKPPQPDLNEPAIKDLTAYRKYQFMKYFQNNGPMSASNM